MDLLQFQAIVHGDHEQQPGPLPVSFETALAALESLPRMFIEPDGSFVWAQVEADGTAWQLDGNLIDQGPSLAHVELSGVCTPNALDQILTALGWPETKLLFQLARQGVFLNEAQFRAATASSQAHGKIA